MKMDLFVKSIFGAILLMVLNSLAIITFGLPVEQWFSIWSLLANYLITFIIGCVIIYSNYQGLKMSLIVFVIYYLIAHFNILIEAYIFNVTDRTETIIGMLEGLLVAVIFSPIYVYLFKNKENIETSNFISRTYMSWTWRIVLGNVLYLFFYILAGITLTTVYPELMKFYEGKIPSVELIFKTQLFLRGFIFVAVAILMLRILKASLLKKSILVGLVFSILGGISPLIQPNELMPDYVRLGHLFEVGISNFIYGLVLGFLLGNNPQDKPYIV